MVTSLVQVLTNQARCFVILVIWFITTAILASKQTMIMLESRMPGQLACPVWRGLGRNASQQWDYRAPLPPYITYVPTAQGWLYLAVVLDLYSRRIVGWAMSDSLHRQLVIEALQMALTTRQPPPGLLHHSDRGSQYASDDYQALLTHARMVGSMSRKGNCYDNAPVESFFGTLKTELVFHQHYTTRAEARLDIFEYIEVFYNRFRRHSALGYKSPVKYEALPLGA